MAQALFISESALKEASIIDDNVDAKLLQSIIESAQNLYIHPALGTALYQDIQAEIDADDVSTAYQTLLDDWIQPALIEWIKYEGAPDLTLKIKNKAIGKHNDEFLAAASLDEIRFVMSHWRGKAEELTRRLQLYICANLTTYPEYTNNTEISDLQPNSETIFSGIYLGDYDERRKAFREKYQGENGIL
jgi:hypothetical protein